MPAVLNTSPPPPRPAKRPRSPSTSLPNGAPPPRRPRSSSGVKPASQTQTQLPATPTPAPASVSTPVSALGPTTSADAGQSPWNRACNWCQRCLRVLCTADPASGVVVECAWRVDTSRCVRCRGAHRGTYDCFVAPPELQQEAATLVSLWEDAIHDVATQRQVNTAALALVDQFPAANRRAGPVRDNPRLGMVRPPGEEEEVPVGRVGTVREPSREDVSSRGGETGVATGGLSDRTGVRIAKALEDLVGIMKGRDERDKDREKKEKDREKRERDAQREKDKQAAHTRHEGNDTPTPRLTQLQDRLRALTDQLDDFHNAHFQTDTKEQEYRDLRRQLLSLGDALSPLAGNKSQDQSKAHRDGEKRVSMGADKRLHKRNAAGSASNSENEG